MKKIIKIITIVMIYICSITIVKAEEIGSIQNANLHTQFGSIVDYINNTTYVDATFVGIETPLASNPFFVNSGKGYVIFSYAYYGNGNYQAIINGVSLKSGSSLSACEIGNLEPYSDSGVQWKQATAKCYVNFGSNGLERIRFTTAYLPKQTNIHIIISRYATFVGSPTPQSNQDVVNAIQNQQALQQQQLTQQQAMNNKLQTQINQNNTIINQNDQIINGDLPQQSTQPGLNNQDSQNLESELDNVMDQMENIDTNTIQIESDTNTTHWIWETMQRLMNSNSKVFSMVISILSVGLIKLILGR